MPNWKSKLNLSDVFHNDSMSFVERRDAIVARIKAARWYKAVAASDSDYYEDTDMLDAVADLATAPDERAFDEAWAAVYDYADSDHRVWIET